MRRRSLTRKGWRDLTTRPATCAGLALLVAVVTLPLLGGLRARRMLAASQEELEGVPGVPAKTARRIYAQLHKTGAG